jgi:5-methyltetrahydrofolate--homocysteine methyltransferase
LRALLAQRILILDGAMGTMVQRHGWSRPTTAASAFAHGKDLKGNNDLLCITRPDVIGGIHAAYLEAGADIIETNSFNAHPGVAGRVRAGANLAYELNVAAARLAREAVRRSTPHNPDKPRFVAGVLGPTSRTASLSPDVNDPGAATSPSTRWWPITSKPRAA